MSHFSVAGWHVTLNTVTVLPLWLLHEVLEREHPSRSIDPFQPDPEGVGLYPGHVYM